MLQLYLLLVDFVGVVLAYQVSQLLRLYILPHFISFPDNYVWAVLNPAWLVLIYFATFWYEGLYTKRYPRWEEIRQMWKAAFLASLVLFSLVSLGKLSGQISRTVLLLTAANTLWIMPLLRGFAKAKYYKLGAPRKKALIIGAGRTGELIARSLIKDPAMGYQIAGFLDDKPSLAGKKVAGVPVLGPLARLDDYFESGMEVIVAIPGLQGQQLTTLVNRLQKKVGRLSFIPDLFGIPFFEGEMDFFFDNQVLLLTIKNNLRDPFNRFVKRTFDITLSAVLLAALSPVMLMIALIIRCTSEGKIIYPHKRMGIGGKKFRCLKFRTMYADADKRLKKLLAEDPAVRREWESSYKLKDDPRILPIGDFLRKTSLDELPQLFNVLRGDMSLVGPRPVVYQELKTYYGSFSEYYNEVLPGITGLWQISGRSNVNYSRRVSLDVWYVSNWSVWLDLIILLKTPFAVLEKDGAY